MKRSALLAATALTLIPSLAYADATVVSVPVGDWTAAIGPVLTGVDGSLVAAVLAVALEFLPTGFRAVVAPMFTKQVDQLLVNAINYGFATVEEAVKGKTLTLDVKNALVAQAVQYAIDHGAGWLVKWAGGADAIAEKIIARLDAVAGITPTAAVAAVVTATAVAQPLPAAPAIVAAALPAA